METDFLTFFKVSVERLLAFSVIHVSHSCQNCFTVKQNTKLRKKLTGSLTGSSSKCSPKMSKIEHI